MKLYSFRIKHHNEYAMASIHKGFVKDSDITDCPTCGKFSPKRTRPLVIEWSDGTKWDKGSDKLGDFVFAGSGGVVIATEKVRQVFVKNDIKGIDYYPLEMYQNPKLNPPKRITKNTRKRIWLPYDGPALYDLWFNHWCHFDEVLSRLVLKDECKTCNRKTYIPKPVFKGFVIRHSSLDGNDFFRVNGKDGLLCCNEKVKDIIETEDLKNVELDEIGIIMP